MAVALADDQGEDDGADQRQDGPGAQRRDPPVHGSSVAAGVDAVTGRRVPSLARGNDARSEASSAGGYCSRARTAATPPQRPGPDHGLMITLAPALGQLLRDLQAHAPTRAGHQGDPALDADHEAAVPSGSRGLSPR